MNPPLRRVLAAAALAASIPTAATGQELGASAGASYSTGDYGFAERTEIGSAFIGLNSTYRGWRLDVTLPFLTVSSPGEAVDAGGILLPGKRGRTSGLGDLTLRLSRPLPLGDGPIDVSVATQLKLPTGTNGLSTGKVDANLDVEFSTDVGPVSPFVSAGYRIYGDSPLLPLVDGWAASLGATVTAGKVTLIGSYDWAESPLRLGATHELFAVASGPMGGRWGWLAYGSKGLSQSASDLFVGFGLTRSFGGGEAPLRAQQIPR